MNDQGRNGDLFARDGIYGANVTIDTSGLKPDTCLKYQAVLRLGRAEAVSSPLRLCVSAFPVRMAASTTARTDVLPDGTKAVADEILINVKPDSKSDAILRLATDINARVVGSILPLDLYQLKLSSPVSSSRLMELVAQLSARAEVKSASVNAIGGYAYTPNDPEFVNQHGLRLAIAHDAGTGANVWDSGAIGTGVTVTVLDTGLDKSHPDFGTPGNCQLAENDCGAANTDTVGHGTWVAGVVGAKTNNALGVAGIAYGSKIHSIIVTGGTTPTIAQMTQGFTDASGYPASIINASFDVLVSTFTNVASLCGSVNLAVLNGATPVAVVVNAADNYSSNSYYYPARCNVNEPAATPHALQNEALTRKDLFITVANSTSGGSCGSVDQLHGTSNYGAWVDIAAPGCDIRTTAVGGGYISQTGTSFSAPMVSGAAAILKSCGATLAQIEPALKGSAIVTVAYPGGSVPRLDVYRALAQLDLAPTGVGPASSSLNENNLPGATVATLTATDTDTCDNLTFTLVAGTGDADNGAFTITGNQLAINGVADYETKTSYSIRVRVTDAFGKTSEQALTVSVNNLNDNPPIITSNGGGATASVSVAENTTAVTTVAATDADNLGGLTYSIAGGADAAKFVIDGTTGALSFATPPDYEAPTDVGTDNVYDVVVQVSDGLYTDTQAIAVTVTNANDNPPVITSNGGGATASVSVPENTTAVTTVTASDADNLGSPTYSIAGGPDAAKFVIDGTSGALSFVTPPDYEAPTDAGTDNVYDVVVQVSDGLYTDTQAIAVTVTNANDNPPVITSNGGGATASVSVPENTTAVTTVTATDADNLGSPTYSIIGGADAGKFDVNGTTGALSFVTAPDYEAPTDAGANNVYDVVVQASDGLNTGTQAIAVTVTNVSEPPTGNPAILEPDTPANRKAGQTTLHVDLAPISNPDSWPVVEYRWKRDGFVVGANSNSYLLDITDIGGHMSVCVVYADGIEHCSTQDATAVGDPHITTVDGLHYDFQSAGEFVALRDASGMELQVRQTAVSTAAPLADGYSKLPVGVSVNTAIAARVGTHRVSYQPANAATGGFAVRVDGAVTTLPAEGVDLGDGGRVAPQGNGIQIDFPDHSTLIAMPSLWSPHNVWWLSVSVFHTSAHEGIMGARSKGSWLPKLSDGSALGTMPAAMHDRYVDLYVKFADSWRVTDATSLFDYAEGTSTATFTNKAWPTENGPYVAGTGPVAKPLGRKAALLACRDVAGKNENADCVFDVMVMGNAGIAKGHLLNQNVRLGATNVIVRDAGKLNARGELVVTAVVARQATIVPQVRGIHAVPAGSVQFMLGEKQLGAPIKLDAKGQARLVVTRQNIGKLNLDQLKVTARYLPAKGKGVFLPSISKQAARPLKPVGVRVPGNR